jgi:phosphoenolpyruvate carboxykinase (GTP)
MTEEPPAHLTDWKGEGLDAGLGTPRPPTPTRASPPRPPRTRPSPRVGGPGRACRSRPSCSAAGARRWCRSSSEVYDWSHGVFLGSIMASETTAAAAGAVGNLRRDPFAMLPFCGYNMADYLGHWLVRGADRPRGSCRRSSTSTGSARTPTATGFLWPGFGENSRVLEWVSTGARDGGEAVATPIGWVPPPGASTSTGSSLSDDDMAKLLAVDRDEWSAEVPPVAEYYAVFGSRLPPGAGEATGRAQPSASLRPRRPIRRYRRRAEIS